MRRPPVHDRARADVRRQRAIVDGRPLIVWKAQAAADGSLELVEVQPEGGRRMPFDEYVRGLRV